MPLILLSVILLELTGPDKQMVEVNPSEITMIRQPRHDHREHFAPGTRCLIFTADGKYIAVIETCRQVNDMLKQMK